MSMSKTKAIYKKGKITLYQMDCLKGMKNHIKDNSIDVVVTSPPYNLGIDYPSYDDTISREEYLNWIETIFLEIRKKLKDKGSIFLNVGSKPTDPWGPFEVINRFREFLELQNIIHWIKSLTIEHTSYNKGLMVSVGHYKPINSDRFINDNHEFIFHLTKTNRVELDRLAIGVPYKDHSNIDRWKTGSDGLRCRGNCWFIPYKTISSRNKDRPHPASYPYQLAEMCIKLHGIKKDITVLDPFMGIGNTSIACKNLNVNCIGFEIDKDYIDTNISLLNDI